MTEQEGADLSRDDKLAAELAALDEPVDAGAALPEPAPAPPAEPAPQPSAAAEAPAPSQVPLASLLQERQRRKDVEARLQELERRYTQPQTPAPAPAAVAAEPTKPTVEYKDDPAEWLRQNTEILARKHEATERKLAEKVSAYEAEQQQEQQRQQQEAYVAQLDNRYRSDWYAASAAAHEARDYFARQFMAEQQALGADMATANYHLALEERRLAYQAYVNELSPVDLLVARANARGYRPGTPTAAVTSQPAVPAPAAAAPAAAQDDRAQRQQAAARTLSNASGGATPAAPTLRDIHNLSREDYAKWRSKNPNGFERVMGKAG
jgi:hypothetical protein